MINVLLVDDHQIMREGLESLLSNADDIKVVAQASNGQEALACFADCRPDVVVMDLTMPVMNGIEATRRIIENNPDARILSLSMALDRACVAESLQAGAKGYLLKDCAANELMDAIRMLHLGKTYLSNAITEQIINGIQEKKEPSQQQKLSQREQQVLHMIADGMSTKEIAYKLEVSSKTIETIRTNTMKKTHSKSIADLIKYALREGITSV